jgi:hypothetical protein
MTRFSTASGTRRRRTTRWYRVQTTRGRRHITTRSASGFHAQGRGALHGWGGNFQRPLDRALRGDEERAPRHCQHRAGEPQRGEFRATRSNAEHRRHKGRLRTYRTALLFDSPQRCPLSAEVQDSGERPDAKPACGSPRAERSAAASFPSAVNGAARRWPWLASPRTRTRPCGFSRQGRGKRFGEGASCAASSRSPRSPKEIYSSRRQAHRVCGK